MGNPTPDSGVESATVPFEIGDLVKRNLAVALLAATLLAVACGGTSPMADGDSAGPSPRSSLPSPSPASSPSPSPTEQGELWLELWFHKGERLAVEYESPPATRAVGRAAVERLLAGPSDPLATQVPEGTRLLGLTVTAGVATVDLSRDFSSGGGTLSMSMRLAQVVYTLTQFPTVDAVRLEIEGEPVTAFSGEGIDTSDPLRRSDFVDFAPAIVVTAPRPGARIASGTRLAGDADVFEATVSFRVLDASGDVVGKGFTTATCGTGCRGTFRTGMEFSVEEEQDGVVEVYWDSPEDGSPQDIVAVPVSLAP